MVNLKIENLEKDMGAIAQEYFDISDKLRQEVVKLVSLETEFKFFKNQKYLETRNTLMAENAKFTEASLSAQVETLPEYIEKKRAIDVQAGIVSKGQLEKESISIKRDMLNNLARLNK